MSVFKRIEKMLFEDGNETAYIPYDEFSRDFPLDKVILHGRGSWSKKIFEDENKIVILGYLSPNTKYDAHYHNCKETVQVIEGVLIDGITGIKKVKGQSISWGKKISHKPESNGVGCTIVVTFDRYES